MTTADELKKAQQAVADAQRQLDALRAQQAGALAQLPQLTAQIDAASRANDAKTAAKLPDLSASKLAAENQVKSLSAAIDAAARALADATKERNRIADEVDRELLAATAAELQRRVFETMRPYMQTIADAEGRLLTHNHPTTLTSLGILDLRRWYIKAQQHMG